MDRKSAPPEFSVLSEILSLIDVGDGSDEEGAAADTGAGSQVESEVCEGMPPFVAAPSSRRKGDQSIVLSCMSSDEEKETLLHNLFTEDTPCKKARVAPESTPPKSLVSKPSPKATPPKPPLLSEDPDMLTLDEIDKCIESTGGLKSAVVAPTTKEYRATFKRPAAGPASVAAMKKKPAAAKSAVKSAKPAPALDVVPASASSEISSLSVDQVKQLHRAYSKGYHGEVSRLKGLKNPFFTDKKIKVLASVAGKKARKALKDTFGA